MDSEVKKIMQYTLGSIFTAIGLLLLLGVLSAFATSKDIDTVNLFIQIVLSLICLYLGLYTYNYFGLRKSKR